MPSATGYHSVIDRPLECQVSKEYESTQSSHVLRKALVVSLLVLFSAVLFTALLPLVYGGLMAFYGYESTPASSGVIWDNGETTPARQATKPFVTAENFFMFSWVSITAGLSVSATAAAWMLVGLITKRIRQSSWPWHRPPFASHQKGAISTSNEESKP